MADGFLAAILADSLSANSKKCSFLCTFLLSHPARGAWIEMRGVDGAADKEVDMSHPARGAWIEIPARYLPARSTRVAPRKGCVD